MLKQLHHVAYRCRDSAETVDFYTNGIGMKFAAALIDYPPSHGPKVTNNNVFFEMDDGSYIGFFEILGSEEPMVPVEHDWAQHLALEVSDDARAEEISARLRARGVHVLGPVSHGDLGRSWYLYDPSGHQVEFIVKTAKDRIAWDQLNHSAYDNLARWQAMKSK
jgi:catechol 2,3-dioxygenase-like lactoylglutathione lyase family enzyme